MREREEAKMSVLAIWTWSSRPEDVDGVCAALDALVAHCETEHPLIRRLGWLMTSRTLHSPKATAATAIAAPVALATLRVRSSTGTVYRQAGAPTAESLCGAIRSAPTSRVVTMTPKTNPPTCAKNATPPPCDDAETSPKFASTSW